MVGVHMEILYDQKVGNGIKIINTEIILNKIKFRRKNCG